jgi:glycogen operon protein
MVEFFKRAIALTRRCTILQRRKFYLGQDLDADNIPDLCWFSADGGSPDWSDPELRTLCVQLDGGEEQSDLGKYFLFLILHADYRLRQVRLPKLPGENKWYRILDTSLPAGQDILIPGQEILLNPQDAYLVNPRSTVLMLGRRAEN